MLHDIYEDMDPEYVARIFQARKKLVSNLDSTLLPENGLRARAMLDNDQMQKVAAIRERRLKPVLSHFTPD